MRRNSLILLAYIASFAAQYLYLGDISISTSFLSNVVSVLSIFFGFYIVGLSIFATSKFASRLYLQESTSKRGFIFNLLYQLLAQYKRGLVLNLVSILYFLFLVLINTNSDTYFLQKYYFYLVIPLIVHNFAYAYLSLNQLLKIVKQDAKANNASF